MAEWGTSKGLLTDYEGEVVDSAFVTDPQYQNGEVLMLEWTIETNDPERPVNHERFPCGNNWESVDGGKTAQRMDGKDSQFNEQSAIGRIINRVMGQGNGAHLVEQFEGVFDALKERGTPDQADIWKGMRFRFEEEEFDYGGEIGVKTRNMPVEFLGMSDSPKSGGGSAGSQGGSDAGGDDETTQQLVELAKSSPDHDTFVAQALKVEGVSGNPQLLASVANDGKAGFYEQNKG